MTGVNKQDWCLHKGVTKNTGRSLDKFCMNARNEKEIEAQNDLLVLEPARISISGRSAMRRATRNIVQPLMF